ncbi:hypothetical protein SAMN05444266_10652 [Chitinophaga jiangningensis]|uniref:Uncharacterized protein n=1 Tax=Chitinophaga jiangningensis TaxID=1419482 RepID=A0A1M7F9Q2_9BACT|nr:hypothetical protein [Chitinophaga jiangningensis]SHM00781.1 hypothetical protein SAMN05444266_10652 [Chitinophaga jiangningensis]
MKMSIKSLMLLAVPALLLLCLSPRSRAATLAGKPAYDTCLTKTDVAYEVPDSLRKKINALIEDKIGGGIDEKGIVTWENSPDAPEYYQVILRKTKLTIKYKGTVCVDKLIWENIQTCESEVKKMLNK